jgi:hypothetical protein
MAEEKKRDPRTVLLKRVRISYPSLFAPSAAVEGGKESYSSNLIIEFGSDDAKAKANAEANKAACIAGIRAAGDEKWGKPEIYKTIMEDNPKRLSFRKGERWKNDEGEVYAGYAGNYALSVSGPRGGKLRPKLKDRHKRDVVEKDIETVFYPGTYCDAYVSFYGTDEGGKGIFGSIELIRSHQEGPMTARQFTYDDDELDDLDDDLGDDDLGGGTSASDPADDDF